MKDEIRKKYIDNLYASLHTLSGKCLEVNLSKTDEEPIVKTAYPKKEKGVDLYYYYMQLNPNKAVSDHTLIKRYSDFQNVLRESFERIEAVEFRVTRADLSFNTDNESDYELFKKLNRLLICCIADKYQIENCYHTTDLWSNKSLSIAVKNSIMEVENYNKELESKGKTDAKTRLELRSKGMRIDDNIVDEFTVKWFKRLDGALEHFEAVQDRYNKELYANWIADQSKEVKDRTYISWTAFLLANKECIFTKKQLTNLFRMIGAKNPEKSATNFKDRHRIEFYSKTDLKMIIRAIKDCTLKYFQN